LKAAFTDHRDVNGRYHHAGMPLVALGPRLVSRLRNLLKERHRRGVARGVDVLRRSLEDHAAV